MWTLPEWRLSEDSKGFKIHKFQKKVCLGGFKWQGKKMVSGPLTVVSATSESRTPEARRQFSLQTCIPKKVPLSHITHLYGYLFQMYLEDNVWVENKWYKQLSYLKHHLSKTIRMFPMFFKVRKEYFFILPPLKKCRMIQSTKCLGLNYHNI